MVANNADEYVSGDMRGAHLKLAQRHRVIIAGQLYGRKKLEPEFPHPGVTGQLALSFTASTALPVEARITCVLPDHGWVFPSGPINSVLRLAQGLPTSAIQATYSSATRTLELTLLSEQIPADVPVTVILSGITTPVSATPAAEVVVTSYEKLVVRNTVPPSTRGGQVLDGPTTFTIPSIVPGELTGFKKWQPFNCCPSAVSDATLSFVVHGKIPVNGKILVELPADGWDMDDSPQVLLRTSTYHNESIVASWRREQHTLEVDLGSRVIKNGTNVILSVRAVKNPGKETMNATNTSFSSEARVTTLVAGGGVIDGPSKMEIARISELRESDFLIAKQAFDEACADGSTSISLDKIPDVLRRTGVVLRTDLYETLVVANLPRGDPIESEPSTDSTAPPHQPSDITRTEFLIVFAQVYAPAYKYGQELRLACGRGDVGRIHEYVSRGCDANAKDGSGWGALHYAAEYGHVVSIDSIVEAMASVKTNQNQNDRSVSLDVNLRDLSGWTPLLCAAANGHTQVVHKLLSLGADLSIASVDGRTALHWAATRGMSECVTALIAAGATTNTVDRNGWTPLHCATLHGCDECIQILKEHGADADCKDRLHYTPDRYNQDHVVCDTSM